MACKVATYAPVSCLFSLPQAIPGSHRDQAQACPGYFRCCYLGHPCTLAAKPSAVSGLYSKKRPQDLKRASALPGSHIARSFGVRLKQVRAQLGILLVEVVTERLECSKEFSEVPNV